MDIVEMDFERILKRHYFLITSSSSLWILSSLKIMIIFKDASGDFDLMSANKLLKIIIVLGELWISQLFS